jgi:hypothetical protein
MYTLILTIMIQWNDAGISSYSIPNFSSLNSCTTAGTQWLGRQMKGLNKLNKASYDISALCVKQ